MNYRMASVSDIDLLVELRLEFIEADENSESFSELKENCYTYFRKAFSSNTCDVVLAETNGKCIGTGIIFYYASVPSKMNITGKNAYITSMFVAPEYRRQGIGSTIVNRLVDAAITRGYKVIMLNASDMGKPMYEAMGFNEIHNGMILKLSTIR